MRHVVVTAALAAILNVATPRIAQAVYTAQDFVFSDPNLSVQLVLQVDTVNAPLQPFYLPGIDDRTPKPLGDGSLAVVTFDTTTGTTHLSRLKTDGQMVPFLSLRPAEVGESGLSGFTTDPAAGLIWVFGYAACDQCNPQLQVWLIRGMPRVLSSAGCPNPPGDLAPGNLDESVTPARWQPMGDGAVTVSDVVALLNAAVGRTVIDCTP